MAKMVKSAQGEMVDWDLLKIQTQVKQNVAETVEIVDQTAVAARRQQRARLDAAKKLLDAAQKAAPAPVAPVASTKAPVVVKEDIAATESSGETSAEPIIARAPMSKKDKSSAGTY